MRLPRMTTRRWMVAVVATARNPAVALEVTRELRLASHYRLKAKVHASQESIVRTPVEITSPGGFTIPVMGSRELGDYHEEMRRKYEIAATRPWKPVEPDPPAPR